MMKWKNSLSRALSSSVVALAALAQANTAQAGMKGGDCKPDPFAFSFPKDMNLDNPNDIYFYVTGLAMQASEGGLEYGIYNETASAPLTKGKVYNFDWSYNPGVRVGFGGYINHDAWNLEANWTWLHFTNYEKQNVTGTATIIPTWMLGSGTNPQSFGQSVNAKWNGHFNEVDVWMGKPYHVSRAFVLNPTLGLRLAFIDQDFDIHYGGQGGGGGIAYNKNNFWGLGLRAGMSGDWHVSKEWKFFGTVAGSLLRGHFAVHQSLKTPSSTVSPNGGYTFSEHFWDNTPEVEMSFGLAWGKHFNCDKNYVCIRAAYEFQEWFDQLQLRKVYAVGSGLNAYANEAMRSNFSLNGFSLSLQFDF